MNGWMKPRSGGALDFEQRLLDSARDDAASGEARARIATALGIDLARVDASGATNRVLGARHDARPRVRVDGARLDILIKYTLIGVAGGLVALGASSAARRESGAIASDVAVIEGTPAVATPAKAAESLSERDDFRPRADEGALDSLVAPTSETGRLAEPARSRGTAKGTDAQPGRAAHTAPKAGTSTRHDQTEGDSASNGNASADQLLREVKQLDRVRAALDAAQTQRALTELDRYDARFPRGALEIEAIVLRVRALQRAGQFALATRLARHAVAMPGNEQYRFELERLVNTE
jgi:hypothetical protein